MTKDQYLRMVEQTGEEIEWNKVPPELDDFPDSVIAALNIYNSLGNIIQADIGYTGKDYTNLKLLCKLYGVQPHEEDWLFELILFLDYRAIEESRKQMKAEYDKMKRR